MRKAYVACRSIVLHEYAHVIDYGTGNLADDGARAYSEGFADAFAMLLTGDNKIGIDLLGKDEPLRDYSGREPSFRWHDGHVWKSTDVREIDFKQVSDETISGNPVYEYAHDKLCDGPEHFRGRQYAWFVRGLLDRLVSRYKSRAKAFDVATTLLLQADDFNPKSIADAPTHVILADKQRYGPGDRAASLHSPEIRAAAAAVGIPAP